MDWRRWPVWPFVCSCWLHGLLLAFPVALEPPASLFARKPTGLLEVRLPVEISRVQSAQTAAGAAFDAAAMAPDSATSHATTSLMPNQPPIALRVPDRYFSSAEVDHKAEPIEVAPLIYPEEAYLRRLHGKVILRLYINEKGSIDSIDVLAAEPPGVFDQAAVDAALATRFRPASLLNRPVKNVKTIEVRFNPLADG